MCTTAAILELTSHSVCGGGAVNNMEVEKEEVTHPDNTFRNVIKQNDSTEGETDAETPVKGKTIRILGEINNTHLIL